jgi:hypothetical protein
MPRQHKSVILHCLALRKYQLLLTPDYVEIEADVRQAQVIRSILAAVSFILMALDQRPRIPRIGQTRCDLFQMVIVVMYDKVNRGNLFALVWSSVFLLLESQMS